MKMAHIGGVAGHFLKDLIDQSGLSLEKVHIIGFSYGGQVSKKPFFSGTTIVLCLGWFQHMQEVSRADWRKGAKVYSC